jgi:hypothetical protein
MAWAGVPSPHSLGSGRVRLDGLEAGVRALDPGSRALLDLSLRRRLRDDDMAPLLRIDAFNLAWRRARALERVASGLGLRDPSGLAQVRAALPHLPERAWCVPLALAAGPPVAEPPGARVHEPVSETILAAEQPDAEDPEPLTVDGEAVTMEFEALAVDVEPEPAAAPEHAWGPRALALRPAARRPAAASPAPPPLPSRIRHAVAAARTAAAARPGATRGAVIAGASALVGALISRRRR